MKPSLATATAIIALSLATPLAAHAGQATNLFQDQSENQITAQLNQKQLQDNGGYGVPSDEGMPYGQNPALSTTAIPEQIAQPPDDAGSLSIIE
jgi:hypothetical protein